MLVFGFHNISNWNECCPILNVIHAGGLKNHRLKKSLSVPNIITIMIKSQ